MNRAKKIIKEEEFDMKVANCFGEISEPTDASG
jgi:hypothetical protein